MSPYDSVDLTGIIKEDGGKFLVYRSPDSADYSPAYELIAECVTRQEAVEMLEASEDT